MFTKFGEPNDQHRRVMYGAMSRPVPHEKITDSGPCSSFTLLSSQAMRSSASSQPMRSQRSRPRSAFARRSGCVRRFGLFTISGKSRQRTHRRPSLNGFSGSPSTFTSSPSSLV